MIQETTSPKGMTNVQMLVQLSSDYEPAHEWLVTEEEIDGISEWLELDGKTRLELTNLRDTAVLLWETEQINRTTMSAVTAVIDQKLFGLIVI